MADIKQYLDDIGLSRLITLIKNLFTSHTSNTDNPHQVTMEQLGVDTAIDEALDDTITSITGENGVLTVTKGDGTVVEIDTQENFITLTQDEYNELVASDSIDPDAFYFITGQSSSGTVDLTGALTDVEGEYGNLTFTKGDGTTKTVNTQENFITLTKEEYETLVANDEIDEENYYFITDDYESNYGDAFEMKYVTFTADGWNGSGPYTQTVSVDGITADDDVLITNATTADMTEDELKAYTKAYSTLCSNGFGETGDGNVTWTCYKQPETDVTVGMIILTRSFNIVTSDDVNGSTSSGSGSESSGSTGTATSIIVNVPTDSWTVQDDRTYIATIAVEGVTEDETFNVTLYGDITDEQAQAFDEYVTDIEVGENQIILTASQLIEVEFDIELSGKTDYDGTTYITVEDLIAKSVSYDDTNSELGVDNVQDAIDVLSDRPVNNNILINSNFANPVNQRGVVSGTTFSRNEYTLDRWKVNPNTVLTINANESVAISNENDSMGYLYQRIEDLYMLANKTVTWSAKVNGTIYSMTGVLEASTEKSPYLVATTEFGNIYIGYNSNGFFELVIAVGAGSTATVEWAKLELSDHATPYVTRSYGEELQLCRRYFRRINATSATLMQINTNDIIFQIDTDNMMRVPPTITNLYDLNLQDESGFVASISNQGTLYINIKMTKESHGITISDIPCLTGYICLDAEL